MVVQELAHVFLRVADLDRSLGFYRDTLGLPVAQLATLRGRRVAFFSFGAKHHDFAMMEYGPNTEPDRESSAGVHHLAFKVGAQGDLDALRRARDEVAAAGYAVVGAVQHVVTSSVYVRDPDGITVELFVDTDPATYRHLPQHLGANPAALVL